MPASNSNQPAGMSLADQLKAASGNLKKVEETPNANRPLTLAEQLQAAQSKLKKIDDVPAPPKPLTLAE